MWCTLWSLTISRHDFQGASKSDPLQSLPWKPHMTELKRVGHGTVEKCGVHLQPHAYPVKLELLFNSCVEECMSRFATIWWYPGIRLTHIVSLFSLLAMDVCLQAMLILGCNKANLSQPWHLLHIFRNVQRSRRLSHHVWSCLIIFPIFPSFSQLFSSFSQLFPAPMDPMKPAFRSNHPSAKSNPRPLGSRRIRRSHDLNSEMCIGWSCYEKVTRFDG